MPWDALVFMSPQLESGGTEFEGYMLAESDKEVFAVALVRVAHPHWRPSDSDDE